MKVQIVNLLHAFVEARSMAMAMAPTALGSLLGHAVSLNTITGCDQTLLDVTYHIAFMAASV